MPREALLPPSLRSRAGYSPLAHFHRGRPDTDALTARPAFRALPTDLRPRHSGRPRQVAHWTELSCSRRHGRRDMPLRGRGLQRRATPLSAPAGDLKRHYDQAITMEPSMRYVLQACVFLAVVGNSVAHAQQGQQQVQPVPLVPTPLIQSQTSTACLVSCNTQAMNCQNACVVVGPPTPATTPSLIPNAAGTSPCALNCTSQQLVCQQTCNRSPQQ